MMVAESRVWAMIPVTDLERSKKFYTEVLGLEMDHANTGAIRFKAGQGTYLAIYQRPPTPTEHTLASFHVQDIEKAMAELREKGVEFEEYDFPGLKTENGIAVHGDDRAAWFKDPDGHILGLNQIV